MKIYELRKIVKANSLAEAMSLDATTPIEYAAMIDEEDLDTPMQVGFKHEEE